jgi:hypothetical protein
MNMKRISTNARTHNIKSCFRRHEHFSSSNGKTSLLLYYSCYASFLFCFSSFFSFFLSLVILSSFFLSLNLVHAFPICLLRVCFPDKYISITSSPLAILEDYPYERQRKACAIYINCPGKNCCFCVLVKIFFSSKRKYIYQ